MKESHKIKASLFLLRRCNSHEVNQGRDESEAPESEWRGELVRSVIPPAEERDKGMSFSSASGSSDSRSPLALAKLDKPRRAILWGLSTPAASLNSQSQGQKVFTTPASVCRPEERIA